MTIKLYFFIIYTHLGLLLIIVTSITGIPTSILILLFYTLIRPGMFCYASILFPITHVTAVICGLQGMTSRLCPFDIMLENAVLGLANSAINLDARLRILIPSLPPVNDRIILRVVGDSYVVFSSVFFACSAQFVAGQM